jgi:hypothetical protein
VPSQCQRRTAWRCSQFHTSTSCSRCAEPTVRAPAPPPRRATLSSCARASRATCPCVAHAPASHLLQPASSLVAPVGAGHEEHGRARSRAAPSRSVEVRLPLPTHPPRQLTLVASPSCTLAGIDVELARPRGRRSSRASAPSDGGQLQGMWGVGAEPGSARRGAVWPRGALVTRGPILSARDRFSTSRGARVRVTIRSVS